MKFLSYIFNGIFFFNVDKTSTKMAIYKIFWTHFTLYITLLNWRKCKIELPFQVSHPIRNFSECSYYLYVYVHTTRKFVPLYPQKHLFCIMKIFSLLVKKAPISELWVYVCPLFINKRFVLNKMLQRNASKFAIFYA